MIDRRGIGIAGVVAWSVGIAACAGDPGHAEDKASNETKSFNVFVGRPTNGRAPTDVAECQELKKPNPDCHWIIVQPNYCGGPVPPPEMLEAGCACVTCAEDAHCSAHAGGRCKTLRTNEDCNAGRAVCVYPDDPCYDEKAPRCAEGEQCIADGGVAHCGTFVLEPPRP